MLKEPSTAFRDNGVPPRKSGEVAVALLSSSSHPEISRQAGFPYVSLDPSTAKIRLLSIEPAAFDEPIRCTLSHVVLDEDLGHEALSYVWGDENKTLPIEVDSHTVQVTTNLEAALRHLRDPGHARNLWIDAICINQSDAAEKSQQVLRMTGIYKFAKKVVVWLGKDDDDDQEDNPTEDWKGTARASAEETFLFARESAMFLSSHASSPYQVRDLTNEKSSAAHLRLVELLSRKWFQRMWTLQEIAVATDTDVVCGTASVPWKCLMQTLESFTEAKGALPFDDYLFVRPLSVLRDIELCRIEHKIFVRTGGEPFESKGYEVVPLVNALFHVVGRRKMKDARDRLYGILGLYYGAEKWSQDARLCPDYTKSVADVFTGLARHLVEEYQELRIICASQESSIEGIPSWVPTWGSWLVGTHLQSYIGTKPIKRRYGVEFDPVFSNDGGNLTVKGRQFSSVEFIGTPADETAPDVSELTLDWTSFTRRRFLQWKQEVTSCPLLRHHYRDTSWKHDIEEDFRDMVIHGFTVKGTDFFYGCLANEHLMEKAVDSVIDTESQEARDQSLKVMLLDQARWCGALYGRLGTNVPFVTRQGEMGLAANGSRPQLGDILCNLYGVPVPVILREQAGCHKLIGPCYIKEWMDVKHLQEVMEVFVDVGEGLKEFRLE